MAPCIKQNHQFRAGFLLQTPKGVEECDSYRELGKVKKESGKILFVAATYGAVATLLNPINITNLCEMSEPFLSNMLCLHEQGRNESGTRLTALYTFPLKDVTCKLEDSEPQKAAIEPVPQQYIT